MLDTETLHRLAREHIDHNYELQFFEVMPDHIEIENFSYDPEKQLLFSYRVRNDETGRNFAIIYRESGNIMNLGFVDD